MLTESEFNAVYYKYIMSAEMWKQGANSRGTNTIEEHTWVTATVITTESASSIIAYTIKPLIKEFYKELHKLEPGSYTLVKPRNCPMPCVKYKRFGSDFVNMVYHKTGSGYYALSLFASVEPL